MDFFDKEPCWRETFLMDLLSFEAAYHQSDNLRTPSEYPKYLLFGQVPVVSTWLSATQVESLWGFLEEKTSAPLFLGYRPQCSLTRATARLWWGYVLRCLGRLSGRSSWFGIHVGVSEEEAVHGSVQEEDAA